MSGNGLQNNTRGFSHNFRENPPIPRVNPPMPPTTMMVPMEEAAASPYSASLSTCTNVSGLSERTKQELNALKTQLKKAEDKYEKTLLNVHL